MMFRSLEIYRIESAFIKTNKNNESISILTMRGVLDPVNIKIENVKYVFCDIETDGTNPSCGSAYNIPDVVSTGDGSEIARIPEFWRIWKNIYESLDPNPDSTDAFNNESGIKNKHNVPPIDRMRDANKDSMSPSYLPPYSDSEIDCFESDIEYTQLREPIDISEISAPNKKRNFSLGDIEEEFVPISDTNGVIEKSISSGSMHSLPSTRSFGAYSGTDKKECSINKGGGIKKILGKIVRKDITDDNKETGTKIKRKSLSLNDIRIKRPVMKEFGGQKNKNKTGNKSLKEAFKGSQLNIFDNYLIKKYRDHEIDSFIVRAVCYAEECEEEVGLFKERKDY